MAEITSFTPIGAGPETTTLLIPFLAIAGLAVVLPLALIVASKVLGGWAHGRAARMPGKDQPFEAGLASTVGSAGERFSVKFYLVAMLFLAFDIEVAFLYAWAWQFGKVEGWSLLWMLIAFLVLLEVGYLYLFRKGALDWDE